MWFDLQSVFNLIRKGQYDKILCTELTDRGLETVVRKNDFLYDLSIFADGTVNEHCVPESIIHLLFSNDSAALYALGSSGTIYKIDIHDIASECDPVKPETIWQMQMGKVEKIRQNMYELGLFNNK